MKIAGSVVVVTGASRGIGEATARALGRAGARLALLARSPGVEQVAREIQSAGGEAFAYRVDLTDSAAVALGGQQIMAELGTPDIVINNAGEGRWLSIEETQPDEAVAMMASPYFAAFNVTRVFLPAMLERRCGAIVNVITKSGTNQLHGNGYEFYRNAALNANSWFSNRAGRDRDKDTS